jgi:hypothetical protein
MATILQQELENLKEIITNYQYSIVANIEQQDCFNSLCEQLATVNGIIAKVVLLKE